MGDALAIIPDCERELFRRRLAKIAGMPGAAKVILFGSYAKGTATADSDIDLAVFFDAKKECFLDEYRQLVDICSDSAMDIQVQAFGLSELEAPCGITEEIVAFGVELPVTV